MMAKPVLRRFFEAICEPDDEIGPQMRKAGLRPEDVRWVTPTHVDADHAGGVGHSPNATVLVHRTEWEHRNDVAYRWRCQPKTWPAWIAPSLYDLADVPYGPFERSLPLTDREDVVAVPTPGHSHGHVAIVIRTNGMHAMFGGDHILRQSWYAADMARGVHPMNIYPRLTADTNRRLRAFVDQFPTLLLPSHDAEAAQNIAAWEPLKI
jgi:glyoxylase-like metal-dependent hydrolase (beta-lactamase superfamily II)